MRNATRIRSVAREDSERAAEAVARRLANGGTLVVHRQRGAHRQEAKAVLGAMLAPIRLALRERPAMFERHHYDRAIAGDNFAATVHLDRHADELRDAIAHGLPRERALDSIRYLESVVRAALAEREGRTFRTREHLLDAQRAEQRADTAEDAVQVDVLINPDDPGRLARWIERKGEEIAVGTVALDAARDHLAALRAAPSHQPPSAA